MKSALFLATIPLVMVATSSAATTIFTDQGLFLAAITDPYLETFDGINQADTYPGPIDFDSVPYSYSATTSAGLFFNAGSPSPGDVWLSTNTAEDGIIFNFTSGNVFAAGAFFFTTNLDGDAQSGGVAVSLNGGPDEILNPSSTTSFLGFVSDSPINSLSVFAIQPQSVFLWPTVNDMIVGGSSVSVIPEPTSAILTAALLTAGLVMRRRHHVGSIK